MLGVRIVFILVKRGGSLNGNDRPVFLVKLVGAEPPPTVKLTVQPSGSAVLASMEKVICVADSLTAPPLTTMLVVGCGPVEPEPPDSMPSCSRSFAELQPQ